jgi:hypothetical protein
MLTGDSLSRIITELSEGYRTYNLDTELQKLLYLAQAHRTANHWPSTRSIHQWFLNHMPNPKERLKAHAIALLSEYDPDSVCRRMGITRHTLNYWKRTYEPLPDVVDVK